VLDVTDAFAITCGGHIQYRAAIKLI